MDKPFIDFENRLISKIEGLFFIQKEVFTIDDLVRYIGKSKSHIYRLTSKGEIPHFKQGRNCYFDRSEINDWLKSNRIETKNSIDVKASTYVALNQTK